MQCIEMRAPMTLYNFSMIWLQLFYSNAQLLHVISFAMSFATYTYRTLRVPLQAFYVLYSSVFFFFFCKAASEVAFASTIYVFIFHVRQVLRFFAFFTKCSQCYAKPTKRMSTIRRRNILKYSNI